MSFGGAGLYVCKNRKYMYCLYCNQVTNADEDQSITTEQWLLEGGIEHLQEFIMSRCWPEAAWMYIIQLPYSDSTRIKYLK